MPTHLRNDIKRFRLMMRPPLCQRELGWAVGCTQSDISAYERGAVTPTIEMALRIARTLGRDVRQVFYGLDARVSTFFGTASDAPGPEPPADRK
jgi:DNA-binding XRE family transcriptional regulator